MSITPLRQCLPSSSTRSSASTDHINSAPLSLTLQTKAASAIVASPTPQYRTLQSECPAPLLSQELQSHVPTCAHSCLSAYIDQEYTCAATDLSCLCAHYSSQGYTLGELAYTCLRLGCAQATQNESVSLYNICSAQTRAVSATHSTLTLPATARTGSGVTTTTMEVYATGSASVTQSESFATVSSRASTISSFMISTSSSSTTRSTSSTFATACTAAAAGGAVTSKNTTVTGAQAVGITVAAFGAMFLAVGLIYLIACCRRRKLDRHKNDRSSYDFVDEVPPRLSRSHYDHLPPCRSLGGPALTKSESPAGKRRSSWCYYGPFPSSHPPANENTEWRDPTMGRSDSPESRKSMESVRTLSQLLPDRPGSMPPPPLPKRISPPLSTPATVFEEFSKPPQTLDAEVQTMPRLPEPARMQSVRGESECAPLFSRWPAAVQHPSLSLRIPNNASKPVKLPLPTTCYPPLPLPAHDMHTATDQRISGGSRAKSQASTTGGSVLSYYASPDADNTTNLPDLPSPSNDNWHRRKAAPLAITITAPSYPPRAIRRSTGSETSFESTDPDEPTPPEEEAKQLLSPVAENSPIAAIRYPKIPRSSNQSIPRSPAIKLSPRPLLHDAAVAGDGRQRQQSGMDLPLDPATPERPYTHDSGLSGSTLAAAKRRQQLYIDTAHSRSTDKAPLPTMSGSCCNEPPPRRRSSTRLESPLKGYGRLMSVAVRRERGPPNHRFTPEMETGSPVPQLVARNSMMTQTVGLKSPLWEPKLTPRRRGEDLFLEVGLASPPAYPRPAPPGSGSGAAVWTSGS